MADREERRPQHPRRPRPVDGRQASTGSIMLTHNHGSVCGTRAGANKGAASITPARVAEAR
jgi:hypothetical protein